MSRFTFNHRDHLRSLAGLCVTLSLVVFAMQTATADEWVATGSLVGSYLDGGTLVTLADGTALLVGLPSAAVTATVERYHPNTGAWTASGSLQTLRGQGATVTLLPSGPVLVAGGAGSAGKITNAAELYDPATTVSTPTGPMHFARTGHQATLLLSGKVLVSGGTDANSQLVGPAEVYDPASGTWILTGVLNNFRSGHAAVLLLTGRVLAAGGDGTAGTLGSSELYDPLNGTWSLTAPMDQPRGGGATGVRLASGSVLVVGIGSGVQRVSSEVYDPVTATWAPSAVIPSAVIGFIPAPGLVALHDGAPLLALSVCAHIGCFPITTALFDPNAGLWTPTTGPMLSFRSGMTVLSDGRVLLVGNASSFTNPTPPSPAVLFRHDDSTPRLVVSPLTVDIGKTRPGIAVQRTVSLQNTGGAALVGNATTAVPFNILSGSPFTLAPGASATAMV